MTWINGPLSLEDILIFGPMGEWVEYGLLGLFITSFLAATIIPFSSDAVLGAMVLGGFDAVPVVIVASIGNWLGGMTNYLLGWLGKWVWIEKYLRVKREKVRKFKRWVDRYGSYLALFSWFPGVGDIMALALGLFKVNVWKVSAFMFIGKAARYVVIAWIAVETGKAFFQA